MGFTWIKSRWIMSQKALFLGSYKGCISLLHLQQIGRGNLISIMQLYLCGDWRSLWCSSEKTRTQRAASGPPTIGIISFYWMRALTLGGFLLYIYKRDLCSWCHYRTEKVRGWGGRRSCIPATPHKKNKTHLEGLPEMNGIIGHKMVESLHLKEKSDCLEPALM